MLLPFFLEVVEDVVGYCYGFVAFSGIRVTARYFPVPYLFLFTGSSPLGLAGAILIVLESTEHVE